MEKAIANSNSRRQFLGTLTTGAAALGFTSLIPTNARAGEAFTDVTNDADEWFKKVKGKHKIVFDATEPHDILPFAWPRVFLLTNEKTGTPANDCGVVVVLRHGAIGYAMDDSMWSKYNLGEVFKAEDPETKKPATRNPFWKPKAGAFKVPGIGEVQIGINQLQDSGVMFCVCNAALVVYSAAVADGMKMKAEDIYNEWTKSLLPGIQVVPSGVWAVGRAQERGCAYCFAG